MTALIAVENIASLDEQVTITENDYYNVFKENLTVLGFEAGSTVTYRDLIYGLMFKSAAECAYALANNIAGSNENFVKLMNEKAKQLNMTNTKFTNPVGYDDNNYSSAVDIAKLYSYAIDNQLFKEIIETKSYTTSNNAYTLYNVAQSSINKVNANSPYKDYILGGKNGYTKLAGNCLATHATYNDTDYIVVAINAKGTFSISDNIELYENVFNNFERQTIYKKGDFILKIKTKNGLLKYLAETDISVLSRKKIDKSQIKISFENKNLKNIKNGDIFGKLIFKYDGHVIKKLDIHYNEKMILKNKSNQIEKNSNFLAMVLIFTSLVLIIIGFVFTGLIILGKKK